MIVRVNIGPVGFDVSLSFSDDADEAEIAQVYALIERTDGVNKVSLGDVSGKERTYRVVVTDGASVAQVRRKLNSAIYPLRKRHAPPEE